MLFYWNFKEPTFWESFKYTWLGQCPLCGAHFMLKIMIILALVSSAIILNQLYNKVTRHAQSETEGAAYTPRYTEDPGSNIPVRTRRQECIRRAQKLGVRVFPIEHFEETE